MPRALIGTAAFLLLWGAAVAEDGPGVDYSRIQALKASDGPGMARFVRRCVVEGDSLDLALSDCPWSQRPAWRAAATNELVALARAAAPKHRAAALTLLAGVHRWNDDPPDAVLKAFVAGLGHDDSGVRATAALRIRFLGSAAVRGLSQRLLRIADNMKRWSWEQLKLAESLAAHGVTESAPLLLGLLKHSTPDFHRRMAIESLGLLGRRIEASIRKPLLEALRGDPSFAVRREAARALAWLGRPKDVEVLLATARAPGAGALSWIVPLDLAAVSPEVGLPLSKILPGLDHADGNVRSSTLTLLSTRRVMDPSAAHAVKQALLDRDIGVRKAARDALLRHPDVVTDDDVARWLKGRTAEARFVGVTLASARPGADARWAPLLLRASPRLRTDGDIDPVLRFAASRGQGAAWLADELRTMDRPTRSGLLTGPPPAGAKIARAAVLPEGRTLARVRRAVRTSLAPRWSEFGLREAVLFASMPRQRILAFRELLLRKLMQHPWPTLDRAHWALAIMALDEEAAQVGQAALEGVLASQYPLNGLRALLDTPNSVPRVAQSVARLATHPDARVRELVAQLLRRHAPQMRSALAILLDDPLPVVRREAARSVPWL